MQLFISHSSKDAALAVRLQESLSGIGYESSFLDIDSEQGLRAGDEWRDRLFNALAECAAVVYIGTDNSLSSRWCHTELALARWLHKPVIPLAFGTSAPHEVLADIHAVRVADDAVLAGVLTKALDKLGLQTTEAWDPTRSPFPGLRSFVEDEAAVFFGREALIEDLRRLVDPPSRPTQGLVVPVLGPSGSGKSSLVRAGFIPRLRKDPKWMVIDPFTPREAPLEELAVAMHRCARARNVEIDVDECRRFAVAQHGFLDFSRRLRLAESSGPAPRMLVVIDQGEELLTTTTQVRREEFLAGLALNCEAPSDLAVIITARTDMWDRVDSGPLHMYTATTALHVAPFDRSNLVRVIEEPARKALVEFEPGLIERLVDDTGSGLALPFLAFILNKMAANTRRVGGHLTLTHAAYEATGGVQGGIALQARAVVDPTGDEAGMAASVLPLVSLSGPDPAARRVRSSDLTETQRSDLDRLAAVRLVVVEGEGDDRTYGATHEALLSAWEPLADLIQSRQEDLRMRDRLDRQAADWVAGGRGRSGLLEGAALAAARHWNSRSHDLATADTGAFLKESERHARRRRVLQVVAIAVVIGLAVSLVGLILSESRAARRRAVDNRVRELMTIAGRAVTNESVAVADDPVLAAIALADAYDLQPSVKGFVDLSSSLLASPVRDVWSAQDPIGALGLAAAGDTGVSVGALGAKVWDLPTGELIHNVPGVLHAEIRPDGRVIAATKSANVIDLIDIGRGNDEPAVLGQVAGTTGSFSPDGSLLAVVLDDATWVQLWDVSDPTSPTQRMAWQAGTATVYDIAFAGDLVLTVSSDSALRVWDQDGGLVSTVDEALSITAQSNTQGWTGYLGADPTGTRVMVSGSGVGDVGAIIDIGSDPAKITRRLGPSADAQIPAALIPIWSSAFDAEGDAFVTFDLNQHGTVRDTSTSSGRVIAGLDGHQAAVLGTVMLDATTVVSTGLDQTVRVWTTIPQSPPTKPADLRQALCAEFGQRMTSARTESIRKLGFGNRTPCAPEKRVVTDAPLQLASPPERPPDVASTPTTALTESFDTAEGGWAEISNSDTQGTQEYKLVDGSYEISLGLNTDDWTYWSTVAAPSMKRTYAISATVRRESGDGLCGIMLGDSELAPVTISADDVRDQVQVRMFKPDREGIPRPTNLGFVPATVGADVEVGLVVDDSTGTVLIDGAPILRFRLTFAIPSQIGVSATGGTVKCAADDLVVSTA
jgi:TIR domain